MKPLKRSPVPWRPECLRWRAVKVPAGIHRPYMKAGPGWEGIVHAVPDGKKARTLPCVAVLTDGELACPNCKYAPRYGCYLPVYACGIGKQKNLVLQGAKRTWETWSAFKFGELLAVNRGKAERDTILFTGAEKETPRCDLRLWRDAGPADIDAYLLHLWQLKELCDWHGTDWHPSSKSLDEDRSLWVLTDGTAKPMHEL